MSGNMLVVVLPIMAVLLAGLSITALYLWWKSSRDEEDEDGEMQAFAAEELPPPAETPAALPDDTPEGSFISRLTDSLKPIKSGSPAQPIQTSTAVPIRTAAPALPVGNAVEVMRIMRDIADGSLFVEIDGRSYRRLDDITDPEIGRRFMGNVQSLAQFARLGEVGIPDDWAHIPEPAPAAAPPPPPPPVYAGPKASQPAVPMDSKTPGMFSLKRLRGEKIEIPDPVSIPDQIEEVLQYRLSTNSDLLHRSIHIRPGAQGTIRIEVDGLSYESVGDVPDESVRGIIQSAINEWEARQ